MSTCIIGIDFGTSHTSIVCCKENENGELDNFIVLADDVPSYISPGENLADSTIQKFIPYKENCEKLFNNSNADSVTKVDWIIGGEAYTTYKEFLTETPEESKLHENQFGTQTVPAGVKKILMKHLNIQSSTSTTDPFEVFADKTPEYEISSSSLYATMFFYKLFYPIAIKPQFDQLKKFIEEKSTVIKFIIGTPPGCGSAYAEQLKICIKNAFFLVVKDGRFEATRHESLKMQSICIPEPILAGYAWFDCCADEKGLKEDETCFVVDIGAGTVDFTFIERKNGILRAREYDDNGVKRQPIISSGTAFDELAGNAYDVGLMEDLNGYLKRRGVKNGQVLQQIARETKERYSDNPYKAEMRKIDNSKPISVTLPNTTTETPLTSPIFHVFQRPQIEYLDGNEFKIISFEDFKKLEQLAKEDKKFKVFLDEKGNLKKGCEYKPSPNPELDLFFEDIVDNQKIAPGRALFRTFSEVADETFNYFSGFNFNTPPKILFIGGSSNIEKLKSMILSKFNRNNFDVNRPSIDYLATSLKNSKGISIKHSNAIAIGACFAHNRDNRKVIAPLRMYIVRKGGTGNQVRLHMHALVNNYDVGQILEPYIYSNEDITTHIFDDDDHEIGFFFSEGGKLKLKSGEIIDDCDIDQYDDEILTMDIKSQKLYYNNVEAVDEGLAEGRRWPAYDNNRGWSDNLFKISIRSGAHLVIIASPHSDNTIVYLLQKLEQPSANSYFIPFNPATDKELTIYDYQAEKMFDLNVYDTVDEKVNKAHFLRLKDGWKTKNKYLYVFFKIGGRKKVKFDPFEQLDPGYENTDKFEIYKPFNTDNKGNRI